MTVKYLIDFSSSGSEYTIHVSNLICSYSFKLSMGAGKPLIFVFGCCCTNSTAHVEENNLQVFLHSPYHFYSIINICIYQMHQSSVALGAIVCSVFLLECSCRCSLFLEQWTDVLNLLHIFLAHCNIACSLGI